MKKINYIAITVFFLSASAFCQTTFVKSQTIPMPQPEGDAPFSIKSADLDGDTFVDLVVGSQLGNSLLWFKNDGTGNFTQQTDITNALTAVGDVELIDVDGNTTIDVMATSFTDGKLVWFSNNGSGVFGTEQLIASSISGAGDIETGTIDGDAFFDVAVVAFNGDKVVWFAGDGTGGFGSENTVDNTLVSPGTIDLKDADGDGDLDVVIATSVNINNTPGMDNSVIELFLNTLAQNSMATFTQETFSVTTGKSYSFSVGFEDIDNDSSADLDIIATDLYNNLSWYKRDQPNSTYVETIIATSITNPASVGFYDLDLAADGGLKDIILSSGTIGTGNDLVWYKNNGSGSFSSETIIDATQSQAYKFAIDDLDNDGDLDIASLAYNTDEINIFNNQKFVLSIDGFNLDNVSVYPNPVLENLFLKVSNYEDLEVTIFDILGKKLIETEVNSNRAIDVSQLRKGLYFLRLNNANTTIKFIKE